MWPFFPVQTPLGISPTDWAPRAAGRRYGPGISRPLQCCSAIQSTHPTFGARWPAVELCAVQKAASPPQVDIKSIPDFCLEVCLTQSLAFVFGQFPDLAPLPTHAELRSSPQFVE